MSNLADAAPPLAKRPKLDTPAVRARPSNGQQSKRNKKANKKQDKVKPGGSEEATLYHVIELLGADKVVTLTTAGKDLNGSHRFTQFQEIELDIIELSSHGEGLGVTQEGEWVVAAPFCLPGERIRAKVVRHARLHSYADLVEVITPNRGTNGRDESRIKCKYFTQCNGCQYQMMDYTAQLDHKRLVVERAFRHFSKLSSELIPTIQATLPSPEQYKYRTKLTPHWEAYAPTHKEKLPIGFNTAGRRRLIDIEECPIATDTINKAYTAERAKVLAKATTYKRGATMLLRHSLPPRTRAAGAAGTSKTEVGEIETSQEEAKDAPVCVTDSHHLVRERIAGKDFEFNAGSFFQNNNGILDSLVNYVGEQLTTLTSGESGVKLRYLIDAYCGSGLFGLALAHHFEAVAGVEISSDSVKYARHNAQLNGISNATFLAGKAEAIFEGDLLKSYAKDATTVLIDPPRAGCDDAFLEQLLAFDPAVIVYVSCNVHTQARDIGYLVNKSEQRYSIASIRGADLFPQTYHCEGVAVLRRSIDVGANA
ncbi:uncharacterized protein L969DRAFT_607360 [Mixia osmundae IAM 14324]|uniref:TRAM domain-containing protein n=1 Tax=Mixia osmundae (strain CBS 9802 / IAM 14324 / JCM 22182 / KY 12970) TaxID=764103 RepID=G7DZF1_MIXOS|nr:uncharacterized protein L969DRAFT_607360 [Mixia osmundae IAM 14324]KEI42574.1 hypothetical protein L969DRAFT_607360 [Mixia osmundae IAM 14324]GAA95961.1 hypothetical protein E5Q_02619 [Mixia osmundae IAM 14324]